MIMTKNESNHTSRFSLGHLLAGRSILIVDDDEDYAEALTEIFTLQQCKVTCIKDPVCALSHALNNPVDLIIVDKNMPRMDGIEFSRRIREMNPSQNIILITAYPNEESRKRSVETGIRYYLSKPFRKNDLLEIAGFMFYNL